MSVDHDDRRGVFVPRWAMEECGGDARDAMVLAQITWWLQPAQRDGRRRTLCVVERKGELWLALTDADLGADLGMSRDQVLRARRSLTKAGLIESGAGVVEGQKLTLTRPTISAEESATSHNAEGDLAQSIVRSGTDPAADSHNAPLLETVETKDQEGAPSVDDAPASVVQLVSNLEASVQDARVEALCTYLADRVEQHRRGDRPKITERSRRDMRLLLERGPLHVDKPEALGHDKVRAAIDAVFNDLATPDGRGFCWADQVRSPAALRDHYTQLKQAWRRVTGSQVGRGAQAVDRVAQRLGAESATPKREPLGLLAEHEPKELNA